MSDSTVGDATRPDSIPPAREPAEEVPFPVVGIGASAGGLEAVSQLLADLPGNTGMAFVLVQHLDPHHESKLVELLSRTTRLPVEEVVQGQKLTPDRVFVIPPNTTMTLAAGAFQLTPRAEGRGPHLPIDYFFKSLADDQQARAIGVVLSGTGSDGTLGVEEIKAAGGFTFAQDKQSAKYASMPQSAIQTGCVDLVLPPAEIARELQRIGRNPLIVAAKAPEHEPGSSYADQFRRILEILRNGAGVDFSAYRDTTVRRRIMRRVVLRAETLEQYAERLERDHAEVESLFHDILINVTSFFRDSGVFEVLKTTVFPEVVKGRDPNVPIRIWVAGCSTGQEAYSLVIALLEFLENQPVRPSIQIFATDLSDSVALRRAREGVYPRNIEAQVSPERLCRFFTREDDHYRIIKSIRDMCVFARQNVAADPPFSHIDLISCRNLLIYLGAPLQRRVIPTFHYALNPNGFLLLGPSETIGGHTDLFAVVDRAHRIFAKRLAATRFSPHFGTDVFPVAAAGARFRSSSPPQAADLQREADRIVINQYAPPGVLVNEDLNILQFRGQTGPYLQPSPGEPSFNLLRMAREGLFPELRRAIDECRHRDAAVVRQGVRVRDEGKTREIVLRVIPVKSVGSSENCMLILFEPTLGAESGGGAEAAGRSTAQPAAAAAAPESVAPVGFIHRLLGTARNQPGAPTSSENPPTIPPSAKLEAFHLKEELASTRDYLQSLIEQHDAANEELKSANEEILSSNEELQSTNEELVTAKEELQSINEELITVNEQLHMSNRELSRLNDDLTNLLSSAGVPMLVLGVDLCIRRFTPAAGRLLKLVAGDLGRPIGNIRLTVDVPDLEALVNEVTRSLRSIEREVRDREGRWYALRVQPYRTAQNQIDGAVVVLLDIDEIKGTRAQLRQALDYTLALVDTVREPLIVLDAENRIRSANRSFYRTFRLKPAETEGQVLYELAKGQWGIAELRSLLQETLPWQTTVEDFRIVGDFEGLGSKILLLNARRIAVDYDKAGLVLLAIEDITERSRAVESLRRSEEGSRLVLENVTDYAVYFLDVNGKVVGWDEGAARTFGYGTTEVVGRHCSLFFTPEDIEKGLPQQELQTAVRDGRANDENWRVRKDGSRFWSSGVTTALRNEVGGLRGFVRIVRDMTETRRAEEALKRSEFRLRVALSAAQMGTWRWDVPANKQVLDENLSRLLGLGADETIKTIEDFLGTIHADDRAAVAEAFARSIRDGVNLDVEFRVVWPDGTIRWLKDQGDVFFDEAGKPVYLTGACVDITLRKRAEEELQRARDELEVRVRARTAELMAANTSLEEQAAQRRELLLRLATTEEDERRRVSRELHDEMGQYLTALILELKLLEDSIAEGSPDRKRLERLKQMTSNIGHEVHRLAVELRPTALDDVGLATTLQNYLDEWSARTGIKADFHSSGTEPRPASHVETTVFRIVQEALTNVVKHSGARRVSVILESHDDFLTVIVEDDGPGFDVEAALEVAGADAHLGLLGMRERVTMVDGTLTIESKPGGPTTLFARVPIAETNERGPHG